jgi:hypothetical protein
VWSDGLSPLEKLGHPRASSRVTILFSWRQTVGSHSNKGDNCIIFWRSSIWWCVHGWSWHDGVWTADLDMMVCERLISTRWCVNGWSRHDGVWTADLETMVSERLISTRWCVNGWSRHDGVWTADLDTMVCERLISSRWLLPLLFSEHITFFFWVCVFYR